MNKRKSSLKPGTLVVFKKDDSNISVLSDIDVTPGEIGIFLRMDHSWKKFMPGMRPIVVLFGKRVCRIYEDEIGLV
jgi:hypothetical protein